MHTYLIALQVLLVLLAIGAAIQIHANGTGWWRALATTTAAVWNAMFLAAGY